MTLEEALAASEAEPVNDIFTVNPESRTITVPDTEKIFGVFSDGNTERKHFRCPKIVGDNIDLSTMHLYVNYQNANGEKSAYLVEDVQTDEDYITFSWLISPNVTAYKGQIKYIVCAKNGATAEWNTTLAEGTVLEGLEATEEIVEKNPDIIEQILARLDNVTEVPQEKISSAVEEYLQKNPVSVPTKLSDLQDDTTHRTVTDTEKESWDSKSDFSGNYNDLEGKPTIPTVPSTLPKPHKLTFAGAVTAEYDGSGAVTVTIPEASGGSSGTVRVEKGSTDTTVELEPNKLYIFPEMASLTYTLAEPADASVANEYHFVFKSGSTATELVHPSTVNVGNFSVDANKVYEISILEGLLTSQNWSVS